LSFANCKVHNTGILSLNCIPLAVLTVIYTGIVYFTTYNWQRCVLIMGYAVSQLVAALHYKP